MRSLILFASCLLPVVARAEVIDRVAVSWETLLSRRVKCCVRFGSRRC